MIRYISFFIILFLLIATATLAEQSARSKSFAVSVGGRLEVSVRGGDVHVSTWSKNEVRVNARGADDEWSQLSIEQRGNAIHVVDNNFGNDVSQYEISIPVQFNMDIETNYGTIELTGKLKGNVTGRTSAGNVRLDDVEGMVEARTSGGDIHTGHIGGNSSLITSGGDIGVKSATGDLEAKTAGGDIRIGNVGGNLRTSTAGGDVHIGDVGGETNVSTSGGTIYVGNAAQDASLITAGGDIELNGAVGMVHASTSGGDIRLKKITGSVDAKTAGGDIEAMLSPTSPEASRISTAAGLIRLFLPETAHATVEARISLQGRGIEDFEEHQIRSDFGGEKPERNRREISARYIINGGGQAISLETVNSDIEIRKTKK